MKTSKCKRVVKSNREIPLYLPVSSVLIGYEVFLYSAHILSFSGMVKVKGAGPLSLVLCNKFIF